MECADVFYTHRVEDDPNKLLSAMGINAQSNFYDTSYNSKKRFQKREIVLEDFEPDYVTKLKATCTTYGYNMLGGFK